MVLPPQRILVIYDTPDPIELTRPTILQHLRMLECSDVEHQLTYFNAHDLVPTWCGLDSSALPAPRELLGKSWDVVLLHYSFLGYRTLGGPFYLWKQKFAWVADLPGLKIAVPQDEGDFASVLDEWLFELGVSVILSVHYAPSGPLYPIMRSRAEIHTCLPGYVDDAEVRRLSGSVRPAAERRRDIVYRARKLPFRYGRAGRMKHLVGDTVARRARELGFYVDISTDASDAIFGAAWMDFLCSGKVVIGSPGGYSAIDWRGELRARSELVGSQKADMTFDEFSERMPCGWDDVQLLTITPRHFEAAMTKTCQLLIEDDYKGVLQPHQHYIPLRQDFSNLDDALELVRDHCYVQAMADRTYADLCLSGQYSYRTLARQIEQIVADHQPTSDPLMPDTHASNPADPAVAALERQLIAARHENALLQSRLKEMGDEVAQRTADMVMERLSIAVKRRVKWCLIGGSIAIVVAVCVWAALC